MSEIQVMLGSETAMEKSKNRGQGMCVGGILSQYLMVWLGNRLGEKTFEL